MAQGITFLRASCPFKLVVQSPTSLLLSAKTIALVMRRYGRFCCNPGPPTLPFRPEHKHTT